MHGPYDVEFRTISVSRELAQRSLEQRRQLDEAKAAELSEAHGMAQPVSRRLVQRLLEFARPGRQWERDAEGAR
jgi:hypothetical protein